MNLFPRILSRPNLRAAFYLLPLFIQWLPGAVYEKDSLCRQAGRQGQTLFLLLLSAMGGLYLFTEVLATLAPSLRWYLDYLSFLAGSLAGLSYLLVSLFFSYAYAKRKESMYHAPFLDRIYRLMEDLLQP